MDYLTRLKNTVSSALPGNPVTREFEICAHRASVGPGLLWKVYDGLKRTTKQEVSVLVFEKKALERYSRRDKDVIIDTLKKGVSQLTRLRHPKILSILHPLEESRESLAFATEPIFASLANVLGLHENMPVPLPEDMKKYKLYDVEIKYGLLQVTEGIAFLHNDVKLLHGNLCPQSIVINKSGSWKIAGFDFCVPNANRAEQAPFYPFAEWDPGIPPVAQPSLDYLAPEYALSASCDVTSDMYSLGVLFYSCFTNGKTIFNCSNEYHVFKKNVEEMRKLRSGVLNAVPDEVRDHIKLMLNTEPTVRPDADQLTKIPFFEDVGAMALQYLDSLMQRDNLQKSQFFKGLPKIIAKMPARVSLQKILPCLFKEALNADMIPFLLPNVLLIAEEATPDEYARLILPGLVPIFKLTEPIQISLVFLQNMNLLLAKTPQADIQNHILPMVYRTLECNMPQLQELCLNLLPTFANLIEYSSMKNALMPRIRKLCLGTTSLSVRVNCLVCLGKLLEYMDKWYVLDEVLPILQEVPSREPAVLMSILGIYKVTMTHKKLGITKDVLATKVLPFIFPMCIDSNLNLSQFNAFMATISEMTEMVEKEHRTKLEQLNSLQQEQRSLQFTTEPVKDVNNLLQGVKGLDDKQESMMDKFMTGFGLTSYFKAGGDGSVPSPTAPTPSPSATMNPAPIMNTVPSLSGCAKSPNQPAKVSLTLQEKQRLAQQAELQQRMKSQPALKLSTASSNSATKPPAAKDLTGTLATGIVPPPPVQQQQQQRTAQPMGSRTFNSASNTGTSGSSSSSASFSTTSSSTGTSLFSGLGGNSGGMGMGMGMSGGFSGTGMNGMSGMSTMSGMGGMSSGGSGLSAGGVSSAGGISGGGVGTGGFSMMSARQPGSTMGGSGFVGLNAQPQKKNIDMSAFDSLLPSNPAKKSLSQMGMQPLQPAQPKSFMMQTQGGMGNMISGGKMGQQMMMGNQGGMMAGQAGMMGNLMQPMAPQSSMGTQQGRLGMGNLVASGSISSKPKSDFDELFG